MSFLDDGALARGGDDVGGATVWVDCVPYALFDRNLDRRANLMAVEEEEERTMAQALKLKCTKGLTPLDNLSTRAHLVQTPQYRSAVSGTKAH